MKLERYCRWITVWLLASMLLGCGSPVVNPNRTATPIVPSNTVPPPANSSGLPTLDTPDFQQLPTESVLSLPSDSTSAVYHSVNAGETLAIIAKRYGVTVEKLRSANGLDTGATLKSQQLIYIPKDR
jgi:LysM repeat protein